MVDKNIINAQKSHKQLSEFELKVMDDLTAFGNKLGVLVDSIATDSDLNADPRWLNIGKTQLQQGLMAIKRAVANPDFF